MDEYILAYTAIEGSFWHAPRLPMTVAEAFALGYHSVVTYTGKRWDEYSGYTGQLTGVLVSWTEQDDNKWKCSKCGYDPRYDD